MIEIVLTIVIPLIAGLVLTLLRAIAFQKPLTMESTGDIALDMVFLALGSSGAAFNAENVRTNLAERATPVLLILILIDLLVGSLLLYRRRFAPAVPKVSRPEAFLNLSMGAVTLMLVAGVIVYGLHEPIRVVQ